MGMYTIKSGKLSLRIRSLGAELISLRDCTTGQDYLWNGDPEYWKRTSPVLFPLVGNYKNKEVRHNGHIYNMSQHGFARDMEFELISLKQNEAWFGLSSSVETIRKFPFPFRLEIGYRVEGQKVKVCWKVINTGSETMYFSIGGHPGFVCPMKKGEKQSDYYIHFDTNKDEIVSRMISGEGLATDTLIPYPLEDGYLRLSDDLFDRDALVLENRQTQRVSLCRPDNKPFVEVTFDAPLFGIWSVPKKNAPFVCIEPWYGRCDHMNFSGTLQQREWGNVLPAKEAFEAEYTIEILGEEEV